MKRTLEKRDTSNLKRNSYAGRCSTSSGGSAVWGDVVADDMIQIHSLQRMLQILIIVSFNHWFPRMCVEIKIILMHSSKYLR